MPETTYTDAELGLTERDLSNADGTPLDENIRREIRQNRVLRRELDAANAREQARQRADAFRAAGVPDSPLGEMFIRANPDLTDPEAIKAEFAKVAPPAPAGTETTTTTTETPSTDTSQRIADAGANGTGSAAGGDEDLAAALLAARGDNKKVMEIIANAPPEAGIRPAEVY